MIILKNSDDIEMPEDLTPLNFCDRKKFLNPQKVPSKCREYNIRSKERERELNSRLSGSKQATLDNNF
ncbi:hypothetical protein K3495_g3762 [Podosphaera aphanis]|nr:hypothetical protein K3495_g3762 [Podosphaera aphanis]